MRQPNLDEATAATEMFRRALKFTRTVLSAWDYQGRQARQALIEFLDSIERDFERVLSEPPGNGESFKRNIEFLNQQLASLQAEIASQSR